MSNPKASKDSLETAPILEDELKLGDETAASPITTESLAEPDILTKSQPSARVWYKRPKLMASLTAVILVIIVGAVGSLAWRNTQANQEFVQIQWRELARQSEQVGTTAEKAQFDAMTDTNRELKAMTDKLQDAEDGARKQPTFLAGSKLSTLRSALTDLKSYTSLATTQASDLSRVKNSDLDKLKSLATSTQLKLTDSKLGEGSSIDFDSRFFALNQRFDTIIAAHQNSEDQKQAATDATKSKEEQALQDKTDAEEAVTRWMNGYKLGDVAEMKRWMTAAFAKEYDFGEVTASYRATNYPTGFRQVSSDKKSDQYEIVSTVTYVTKSDYTADTTYTQTFVFLVSRDAVSKRWLVNSRRTAY